MTVNSATWTHEMAWNNTGVVFFKLLILNALNRFFEMNTPDKSDHLAVVGPV